MFDRLLSVLRFSRILGTIQIISGKLAEFSTLRVNSPNPDISRKFLQSSQFIEK